MRGPRAPNVVLDPSPDEIGARIDWSAWYLSEEEDMGQSPEQDDIVNTFASSLEQLFRDNGWTKAKVGRDAFFAWVPREPNVRVSPDVYVMDDPPPPPLPRMWQTWLEGHRPPRFALEVASEDWHKDYVQAPMKYAQLGAVELVIFDPGAAREPRDEGRSIFQHYRREDDGTFVRVYKGDGPVDADTIGVFLHCKPSGGVPWLRLAHDRAGVDLVLTASERAEAEALRADAGAREVARLRARLRSLGVDPDQG